MMLRSAMWTAWVVVIGLVAAAVPLRAVPLAVAQVPETREQVVLGYASVVKRTAPAVVNVFTKTLVRERSHNPFIDDPIFRRFFGDGSPFGTMPRNRVQNSLGSGVVVSADGLIVTNHHVIKDADQITVVLADRREFEAKVVSKDPRVDLAVLRIASGSEKLPFLELRDSDAIEVGDLVLAIGNPFGVGQTVTSGIISAVARTAVGITDYNFFIQTDAAINPGNSGGALVTLDGRLAGINTAIFSKSGGSIGIGFAIPSNMVRSVLAAVASGGKLVRPWLGINGQPVTAEIAASLALARPAGVLVEVVDSRSPAWRGGLRVGDVVLTLNGHEVDDPDALRFRAATLDLGTPVTLGVLRGGSERVVSFALVAPPEEPPREITRVAGASPLSGATIANLSPAFADEINFKGPALGVVVIDVGQGSPAAQVGLRPGDLLMRINETEISTIRDLRSLIREVGGGWRLSLRRNRQVLNVTVRW
ncbi:MAG: DegQ family serine endoprotease [Rhodospirillaceae bacterium]